MKKRLFILEDDEATISLYTRLFFDFDITIARDVAQATMLIDHNKPFDSYIFDIHIKGSRFDGTDLIRKIDKNKAVIVSAIDLSNIIKDHVIIKGMPVFQKPFHVRDFKDFINTSIVNNDNN